eukprot:CAMPEP_0206603590 /NCGR_PEP_ID=MMETSP0325_2-20121206/48587_1 /ASSEMBLY_ACC=CAM_ASM_000347 /TAXON_ID=2866 /ORGANISM="Crypthecodinium cohnii, Strain Seligo" /LENGTH=379 /DNA_ID=CAMNT_0054117325 /DNA_START=108 /DNA_END=1244 /DNA_ORIENTATION=-
MLSGPVSTRPPPMAPSDQRRPRPDVPGLPKVGANGAAGRSAAASAGALMARQSGRRSDSNIGMRPIASNASSRSGSATPANRNYLSEGTQAKGPATLTKEGLLAATGLQRGVRESVDAFLARVTHLRLQGQRLGPSLGEALSVVPALTVLYAFDNLLTNLDGFENLKRLQMLYLQNNRLTSLAGLEGLTNLRVLHLGSNRLAKIDHLENFTRLEELHVANQRPPSSTPTGAAGNLKPPPALEFCPASMDAISSTLTTLDIAGNRLEDVSAFERMGSLRSLDLSNNNIQEAVLIRPLVSCPYLSKIHLQGNPFTTFDRKYRSLVVLSAPSIEEIDGKPVLPQEKDFMRRLEVQKQKAQASRLRTCGPSGSPARGPVATLL